jgi:GTPase Era involved in 16S rRNA processing
MRNIIIAYDDNSEMLSEMRKANTIVDIIKLGENMGLNVSSTDKWVALSYGYMTPHIFMANKMDTVKFKDKSYPIRTFEVVYYGDKRTFIVSVESLSKAMGEDKEKWNTEASRLDNEIYYYVKDDIIELPAKYICEHHLDVEMIFESELFG